MAKRRAQGEGTIYFDQNRDRWVGQAWIGGRRRKVSGKTKRQVTNELGRLRHASAAEQEANRQLTVGRLLDQWRMKHVPTRDLTPSSVATHDWAIEVWKQELGGRRAVDVRPVEVEDAMARMVKGRGLSKGSMIKMRTTLKQAFDWAVKHELVARNPVSGTDLPVGAADRRRSKALTPEQVDALLAQLAKRPLGGLLAVMATTGLRFGEAAGIDASAVDLHARTLTLRQSVRLDERGRPYLSTELKTEGSRRCLRLPQVAFDVLAQRMDEVGRSGLLWTAPNGGPVWLSTVRKELRRALKAADLPEITPRELRTTAATNLSNLLPAHVVADILGHSTTRMLDLHYRDRPPVIDGAEAMDEIVGKPRLRKVS